MRVTQAERGIANTAETSRRVSVIIPAYNVAPFITETLNSVLAQSFTGHEIIVVNDGSPDTAELERALAPFQDRILYVKQDNQGAGAARNAGLRLARGEFVAFLDGDDIWQPNFLADQLELIERGDFDLVYADAVNFGDPEWEGKTGMSVNRSSGAVTFEKLIRGDCSVITSAVLARKDPIIKVGMFNTAFRNSQDFDLWLRLVRDADARISFQRKVLVRRRIYSGSLASDPLQSFQGEISVLEAMNDRDDLTTEQHNTLKQTINRRRATVEILRGKQQLAQGKFDTAKERFAAAYTYEPSWKLRLVLLWLRLAPRTLQQAFKLRRA